MPVRHPFFTTVSLLLVFGLQVSGKENALDIRPVPHEAWGNSPERVQAILRAAAQELHRHFPERPLKPILVEPLGGPIVLFDRGAGGEYRVRLDTGDNLWAQWVFQFSHELGHILSNYDEVRHANLWFEETICEVASLYVLRRLADTWSREGVPANWKSYAPALRRYAEGRIDKHRLADDRTLADWYAEHAQTLARTGYDRGKNTTVAVMLLPLFEASPEHWPAIAHLAAAKKGHGETFAEYLKAWQLKCPEEHRAFVGRIGTALGIDLATVRLGPAKQ